MQLQQIIDLLLEIIISPLFLFLVIMIIVVLAARRISRSKSSSSIPVVKQIRRMTAQLDKGKDLTDPSVSTRDDIITKKFNLQMKALGLEPATDSGYIPVSHTPLARFLQERGVQEDTVSAILAGLLEENSEDDVREIISAAAESPGVDLTGTELEKAQDLAVNEWTNARRMRET
ncbi:MAG: hypothetical protein EAX87_04720 [Candidatus Thorarchaeota archaeon]|nr:hypothetical protein [Candidatus Thorarchaeota archaeon]